VSERANRIIARTTNKAETIRRLPGLILKNELKILKGEQLLGTALN
jgi:hypothetical protein